MRRAVLATATLALAGCSSSAGKRARGGKGGDGGACGFVVKWKGVTYTDPLFHFDRSEAPPPQVRYPRAHGRRLGRGDTPSCRDGNTPGQRIDLYAVPGVSTRHAVMTDDGYLGIRDGEPVPDVLLIRPSQSR